MIEIEKYENLEHTNTIYSLSTVHLFSKRIVQDKIKNMNIRGSRP
jgi:hypothetical protein